MSDTSPDGFSQDRYRKKKIEFNIMNPFHPN